MQFLIQVCSSLTIYNWLADPHDTKLWSGPWMTQVSPLTNLEVLVGSNQDKSQKHALTAQKVNRILGCIKRNVARGQGM